MTMNKARRQVGIAGKERRRRTRGRRVRTQRADSVGLNRLCPSPKQGRAIRLPYKRRKRNSALSRGADNEVQSERNEEMADSIRRKWTLYMPDNIRRNERNVKKALAGCEGVRCRDVIIAWLAFQATCWDDSRIPESNSKS